MSIGHIFVFLIFLLGFLVGKGPDPLFKKTPLEDRPKHGTTIQTSLVDI